MVIAGFTGSLMVIAVNGWMNNSSGFRLENGRAVDVEPIEALRQLVLLARDDPHVPGGVPGHFVTASVYAAARLRGRSDRYARVAMAMPLVVAANVASTG